MVFGAVVYLRKEGSDSAGSSDRPSNELMLYEPNRSLFLDDDEGEGLLVGDGVDAGTL
jgi:hypothetical protein